MDLLPPDGLGIACLQHRGAGQYATLLSYRLGHAHDHVIKQRGVEIIALSESL